MKVSGYGAVEQHASGSWVTDHLGREWLDFCSCYGAISLGHCHREVIEAVKNQLNLMGLSSKVFFNEQQADLACRLALITPHPLQYSFFCNSGTEAVEAALKAARKATGRQCFVTMKNSFHGKTFGALSVSGREQYKHPFEPLLSEVRVAPFGDCAALKALMDDTVAAVILELVQGEGGIHVAEYGYPEQVQEICRKHGALLIIDEVQTGLGRTGKMFACEHFDIEPDILTLAKALGGGIMPIGVCITTREVQDKAYKDEPTLHTSTFGGNPLACTAALATLRILLRDALVGQAKTSGEYLLANLHLMACDYPELIADLRGLGLLIGIEFKDESYAGMMISKMAERRVIAVYTMNQPRVIRFEPPLNVSHIDMITALNAFRESLIEVDAWRTSTL